MPKIVRVDSLSKLRSFLKFPFEVYAEGSLWVPPLHLITLVLMGAPWERSRTFFLAIENDRVVARCGFERRREVIHFGFFECLEGHPEAVQALMSAGRHLAPHLPMQGPYQFALEDPYSGLLVEGFDTPPYVFTSYNPPYYAPYLEAAGLQKAMDLWTYEADWERGRLQPIARRADKAFRHGIRVRNLSKRQRFRDIRHLLRLMNIALQENWGFEPFGLRQELEFFLFSYLFLDSDWFFLAESSSEPVGAGIALPDYNVWLKEARGHLSLDLIWKLLFKKKEIRQIRTWGFGVLPEFRAQHTAPALLQAGIEQAQNLEIQKTQVAWVLENNVAMNAMLRAVGAERLKTHRVLSAPALT